MAKSALAFRFDDEAESAQKAAMKTAAKKIVQVSRETKANVRNLITQAIKDGIPPNKIAKQIGPLVGLTRAQGAAVRKYRRALEAQGLPAEKIDKAADKYAAKLLKYRSNNIARTEILDALNDGQNEAWLQAQDEGLLSKNATKEILLSPEACDVCVSIAEESGAVPIDEDFSEPGPPFHPHCGCTIVIATP